MRQGDVFVILVSLTILMNATATDGPCYSEPSASESSGKPIIQKLGTIECDMVEVAPVVFNSRLYRIEWVRGSYKHKAFDGTYFRVVDVATGKASPPFAPGYVFCSAYVEGDIVYVYGRHHDDGSNIQVFWSKDLENWSTQTALRKPGWNTYNTSVCKAEERYIMAFEVGLPPEVVGTGFTNFFAQSTDLVNWKMLPLECVYSKARYTACPTIRYLEGYFYVIYLETISREGQEVCYTSYIVRSRDLKTWESSPCGPFLHFSDEDRRIANPNLTTEERERIATAYNRNNSDVDLCEFEGRVVIYYSWGDQRGNEFLAEAVYQGTLPSLLRGFFPE